MSQETRDLPTELAERVRRLSDETLVLALEAYREGRRAGAARLNSELTEYLEQVFAELDSSFEEAKEPESMGRVEDGYATAAPSPIVAAHFGGAGDVLARVRMRLDELAKGER